MRKNNPLWILAILLIFILVIFNIVMSMKISEHNNKININISRNLSSQGKIETGEKCPDAYGGFDESPLQIKYFYSQFCPWCIKEEPILQKLVKDYGTIVRIKWYNINECPELVKKYKVSGVPTLIFNVVNNQTEYSHYGFVPEKDIMKLVCDVTGEC